MAGASSALVVDGGRKMGRRLGAGRCRDSSAYGLRMTIFAMLLELLHSDFGLVWGIEVFPSGAEAQSFARGEMAWLKPCPDTSVRGGDLGNACPSTHFVRPG